ncbi:hypothetical protein HDV01_000918 [Terramyces sp. JEL0728]|nr:hypothetical protein HDV01_000918 [Terramyces sp. JEL0728]
MTVIVHHLNNSRSQRILWLLEHLEIDYEIKHYKRDPVTQQAPLSLAQVHPLGKSPVITHDGTVVAETGAIIEYLIDNFKNVDLTPKSKETNLQYKYWLHFAEGSAMTDLLVSIFTRGFKSAERDALMERVVKPHLKNIFGFIENHLGDKEWFAGDFSGADIAMSFPVEAFLTGKIVDIETSNMERWLENVHAMKSYQVALEKGGPYIYSKQ